MSNRFKVLNVVKVDEKGRVNLGKHAANLSSVRVIKDDHNRFILVPTSKTR